MWEELDISWISTLTHTHAHKHAHTHAHTHTMDPLMMSVFSVLQDQGAFNAYIFKQTNTHTLQGPVQCKALLTNTN